MPQAAVTLTVCHSRLGLLPNIGNAAAQCTLEAFTTPIGESMQRSMQFRSLAKVQQVERQPVAVDQANLKYPPWWINPLWYCLFFLLPLFVSAAFSVQTYMVQLHQKTNNLSTENIFLGILSITMFMAGCFPFAYKRMSPKQAHGLSPDSVNSMLSLVGSIALVAYLIYFSSLAVHPELVLEFLSGSSDSMYNVKRAMEQIPGITSFVHAALPFMALYSIASMNDARPTISPLNRRLFAILAFLICARALLGSERLAMVEAAIAYGVPRVTFIWRPSFYRSAMPYFGMVCVFILFCIGEYFRSWQYYKSYYSSFGDFIVVRFLGYFATSINNGAGIVSHYPPLGYPAQTVEGFYRLLKIFGGDAISPGEVLLNQYLTSFATLEFNNAGGLYIPYMDYGIPGGALCFFIMGLLTGLLYKNFVKMSPLAMLLYPAWFLALLDIIRIWIWGSSRFVPVILVSVLVALVLRYRQGRAGG